LATRRSRLFKRLVVTTTGLGRRERDVIEELVQRMGGEVSSQFDAKTTHLVAATVLSAKYKAAMNDEAFRACTVVSTCWPQACWDKALLLDPAKFKVKPCCGLVVAVTNLDPTTKQNIQKRLEKLGAIYSKVLDQNTVTHLISSGGTPSGEKFVHALEWDIPIVDLRWLDTCEKTKAPAPIDEFRLEAPIGGTDPILRRQLDALEYAARSVKTCSIFLDTRIYVPSTSISGDQFKNPFWVACLGLINKGFGTMVPAQILHDVSARDTITHVVLPPDILPLQPIEFDSLPRTAHIVTSDWLLESLKAQSKLSVEPFLISASSSSSSKRRRLLHVPS